MCRFIDKQDDFRFGASKLFRATFTATIQITVGGRSFLARASIVHGEVPLLLSRSVLSGLGMVYDVEVNVARFKRLNIQNYKLSSTSSGHPAIVVKPKAVPNLQFPAPDQCASAELHIVPESASRYMVHRRTSSGGNMVSLRIRLCSAVTPNLLRSCVQVSTRRDSLSS